MSEPRVPFNGPAPVGRELAYIQDVLTSGHLSGDGPYTRRCHALLEEILAGARVLLTTSCTHALELAALLLRIRPGDEVLLPAFTFVSVANAFVLRGARPAFVDVRPDTLNLDERLLADRIGPRARAVVAVHYAGVGCEMGTRMGGRPGDCPVTESVSDRLLRLPFFTALDDDRQDRVIEAVRAF